MACLFHLFKELPAVATKPLVDQTVQEKQEVVFECEFDTPNLTAVWLKDNVDVKFAVGQDRISRKVIGNRYTLTVHEAKLEDLGSYSCTVKYTTTSCNLTVLGINLIH